MKLPLTLPYPEASTVCDAAGSSIAECVDNETARALLSLVNAAAAAAQAEIAFQEVSVNGRLQDCERTIQALVRVYREVR